MTDCYSFIVDGNPVPQPRPRITIRGQKAHAYESLESKDFKFSVYSAAYDEFQKGKVLLTGELYCHVNFFLEIPKTIARSKKKRQLAIDGYIRPNKKPDIDNLVKGVLDGIGMKNYPKIIFDNDSQIVSLTVNKYYSNHPRTEVTITTLKYDK